MFKSSKLRISFFIIYFLFSCHVFAKKEMKTQLPETLTNKSLLSLKTVTEESKFLPTPNGMGGASDNYGWSVDVDGDTAVVGAPKMSAYGIAMVYTYNGTLWQKQANLLPPVGELNDKFGNSVSIDGNRILVGSPEKDQKKGAAFIFDRVGTEWSLTAKLVANDALFGDYFGISVSLKGDKALVGAYKDHDNIAQSGSAYIFSYDGSQWTQQAKLTETSGLTNDYFGYSVSLSTSRALVGAYWDDDNGNNSGSAFIYDFDGSDWVLKQKITASDGFTTQQFGYSVSLDGDTALIGANQDNEFETNNGAVYAFTFDGTTWTQSQKITSDIPEVASKFGFFVDLDGNRVVIGTKHFNEKAYVFEFDTDTWVQKSILTASSATPSNKFGTAAALSGDAIIVGAYGDNIYGFGSGSVFGFNYNSTSSNWLENTKLIPQEGASGDAFGFYVSIDGNTAVVGAYFDDFDNATTSTATGAVYVYSFDGSLWNLSQKLYATQRNQNANFGHSVVIKGNRILIGATGDDGDINNSGAAYIFDYDGSQWLQTAKLTASDGNSFGKFGFSTSLSMDRAVVGGYGDNEFGNNSGAAYVYDLIGGNWTQSSIIRAPDAAADHNFGYTVSIEQDLLFVSAPRGTGNTPLSGAVYVFEKPGSSWQFTQKLVPNVTNHTLFGNSLSLSGNRVLIGSPNEGFGVAYVFELFAGTWDFTAKLQPNTITTGDIFAYSVSLDGDRALIGAEGHTENGIPSGSAFLFDYNGSNWIQSEIITPANPSPQDLIGRNVSISGDLALLGSHTDNDRGTYSGSAYVFSIASKFSIGGTVTGLIQGNELVIQNNAGDDLIIYSDGSFTFPTQLNSGDDYTVSVLTQPNSPIQNCSPSQNIGTINNANITDVLITCVASEELIFSDGFDG